MLLWYARQLRFSNILKEDKTVSDIVFKDLWIFSPLEELAKHVEFSDGVNIVTSSQMDGTDRGKSAIAMSLYHCMGADCRFSTKWGKNKVYILHFGFNEEEFYMYRNGNLFKLFNGSMESLWSTSNRNELGTILGNKFGFEILLPNRGTQEVEVAPPAYSYAPYFVDQNHYLGSDFSSFDRMGQYTGFKEPLVYTLTGVYDDGYYEILKSMEEVDALLRASQGELSLTDEMLARVIAEVGELGYSPEMQDLENDCGEHERRFKIATATLNKIRRQLMGLREEKTETELALKGLETFGSRTKRNLRELDDGVCPLCSSPLKSTIEARVTGCSTLEDVLLMGDELRGELDRINSKIDNLEQQYSSDLSKLNDLKSRISAISKANKSSLQIEGLNQLGQKLSREHATLLHKYDLDSERKKQLSGQKSRYADMRSKVDARFVELITEGVTSFNLQEIELDKITKVTSQITAQGSNSPIATVLWYFALLTLKKEFNPERTNLPLVLDSPLNVETDEEKKIKQYELVFKRFGYDGQVIVTGLGLKGSSVVPEGARVIVLSNEKYQLLNPDDYAEWKSLLFSCIG